MEEHEFITSKIDLTRILSKCPKCLYSTQNGEFILSYNLLSSIKLENYKNRTAFNFIINSSQDDNEVGHWANLVVIKKKILFFLDGLGQMRHNIEIMNSIRAFAKNNNLKLFSFNVRYQLKDSKKCGLLACFIVHKSAHNPSISWFLNLRKILSRNSVSTNEHFMISSVRKHFKLNSF